MGREFKRRKAEAILWAIYRTLREVAREEGIAPTLGGIADQLNRRGLRTNRGKLFDFRKVGAAFDRLGLDRVAVERWKQQARDHAQEWQVRPESLYHQLWHEWQRHVAVSDDQFFPELVHPHQWIPPWERDPTPDWRMMHPSPQARVVHLFLGAFSEDVD